MIDVYWTQDDGRILLQDDGTPIVAYRYQPAPPPPLGYTAADYQAALLHHLPTGVVWPREDGAVLPRLMGGLSGSLARLSDRAAALLQESPQGTLLEVLPEWEATLGLPDPCAGADQTISARQQHVQARIGARGGQSIPYYVAFAAALGFEIAIDEFTPFRAGVRCGQPLRGVDWAHAWRVRVAGVVVVPFRVGSGRAGDRLATWGSAVLECELRRIAPAHTVLSFAYVGSLAVRSDLDGFDFDHDALA